MKDHTDMMTEVSQPIQQTSPKPSSQTSRGISPECPELAIPRRAGRQGETYDLIVLSHLRWDFVFQRPQHLMTRFAKTRRVFFVEEPMFNGGPPMLEIKEREHGVRVVVPRLPTGLGEEQVYQAQKGLLDELLSEHRVHRYALWYYTPMALPFTRHLNPAATVYDCMDELSLFKGAHPALLDYERELLTSADVVFTGGQSLYEHKRTRHPNVHAFPSSIDAAHFRRARFFASQEPLDQRAIPRLRIGFCGVIDERMDLGLIEGVACTRPQWQLVLIGPVVKIDPASLPRLPNIHYLGGKHYQELPTYLAGWDVAMLPFARNESTRFISPTKTPEYLAAGRPVVSTSIRDVVRPYGQERLVRIADTVDDFVRAIEASLQQRERIGWLARVDALLARTSWDSTWERMAALVNSAVMARRLALPGTEVADALPL